ncbi:MAG: hypothetical protein KDA28_03090, partial [Phycisphaerales bacterium]|nr:hypothetical protein [Phycisphaerales bacterium]
MRTPRPNGGSHLGRGSVRLCIPVMSIVLIVAAFVRTVPAQTCLTVAEQKKVKEVIQLMKAAFSAAEKGRSLKMTFGQSGGNQIDYEQVGAKDTTLGQALDGLIGMVERRIKKEAISGRGYTDPRPGSGSDVVVFRDTYIDTLLGTGGVRARMDAKFQLMATLANEMTHVHQRFDGTDLRQCDAERDSDCASILILCKMLNAMTDLTGAAHGSFASMLGDPEYVPGLISCIADLGGSGADIADLVTDLAKKKKGYEDRKANVFV